MERPVTSKSRGICRYYNTSRGCFAGDNCKFKHGEHEKLTPFDESKICRYFASGYCKRGEKCWFKHVIPDPPADPGESLICAICMEEPVTFGLLVDCSHVFCIDCIRNWRGQDSPADDVSLSYAHKKCPYCRTPTKFVVPSSHFYPSGHPGKATTIEQYKSSLQRIPCKYFISSHRGQRYCPFGRDCMYQHKNEDGTPYIFTRGVDHYMPQRDRRLRGLLREVMTRSVFEYYRDFEHYRDFASWIDSPDPSEEELEIPGDLIFGEQLGLEQDDTDNDTYLALTRLFDAWAPNFETPTSGIEGTFTDFPSTSTTSIVALPAETPLMPEPSHTLTSPNAHVPRSPSSSPSSIDSFPSLMSTSECETEPDLPDVTDTSMRSEDSLTSPPTIEPATTSDRVPRGQSPPSTPRSSACAPQRTACVDTGTLLPASPVPLHIDTADSQPLTSSPAPPEVSSMIEASATASTQSPTRDPLPGELSDTRQQEPPFMTDGRGRVVWSRSGVKHGNSPPAACIHDRTQHTGGDRD